MAVATPTTVAEAVALLAAEPELVPIAGCTDLMVGEPEKLDDLPGVVDLLRVPELRGLAETNGAAPGDSSGGGLDIGAATTFRALRDSELVRARFPALAAAAGVVGGWQIQNRATLGGNVANASPAGDSLPVLLALEATAVVHGPAGEREVPYAEFHTGYRTTALATGELLVRLRLPAPAPGTVQLYRKVGTREAQAISKVVVAMAARVEEGTIVRLRLAAGSVAATPVRLEAVERELAGRPVGADTAERAGRLAADSIDPIDDVRSTADYRRWVLGRVVRRMVLELATSG